MANKDSIALVWAQRAQAELGAEARFRVLSEELADLGAHPNVIDLSLKAQRDEELHARLCSQVAKDLGHPTGFAYFQGQPMRLEKTWVSKESPKDRLLCEVVLMCCITETINASLLNTIYGSSQDTPTRRIIHQILKDEVKHSQIGWAHLAGESQKRNCGFIGHYLEEMFEISVKDELFVPPPLEAKDSDSFEYGVMPVELRLNQFVQTMQDVVLPGFENFGIEAESARAWLERKQNSI